MTILGFQSSFLNLDETSGTVVATIVRPELSEEENIEVLDRELTDLVDQYNFQQIVINFENVTYLTSAALGKFIFLHRRLHRKEGRMVVCGLNEPVETVVRTARLHEYFEIVPDVSSARMRLSSTSPVGGSLALLAPYKAVEHDLRN